MAAAAAVSPAVNSHMEDLWQGVIDNYAEASTWYGVEARDMATNAYDYVILTVNAVVNGSGKLDDFEAFKEQQGFNVLTVTETAQYDDLNNLTGMGSGWGGGTGNTAAENIRNWLKNNYQSLGIAYVLLIGNPTPSNGNVPMKMCWPRKGAGTYEDAPTDYYYADLTGNWDLDGDGYYCEYTGDRGTGGIDVNVEVYVGRIPVYGTTYTDLDKILQKTIDYGLDSGDIGWREKVLLPMEVSDSSTHGWPLGENIRTDYAIPNGWESYRIYEQDYGLSPEMTPCTISNVRTEWQNLYGLVTWWTHGSATYAQDVFSISDCTYLDDNYPSFTFQCSCLNSHPETANNLAYELLKNGAIGTVSATRVSWYFMGDSAWEIPGGNSYMADRYSAKIINKTRAGKALFDMKMEGSFFTWGSWMNYLGFNLYGDPAIKIDDADETCPFPAPPESITYPAEDCDGAFTVTWAAVTGATGYTLQRSTDPGFAGAVTAYAGALTSYSQSGLTEGTYYYRVRAENTCGNSDWRTGSAVEVRLTADVSLDLVISLSDGNGYAYENTGDGASPVWTRRSGWDLPDAGSYANPAFADLDGDSDQDAIVGDSTGIGKAYVNAGSAVAPVWARMSAWDLPDCGSYGAPAMGDLDCDGDPDALMGNSTGKVVAYRNTGSTSAPVWTAATGWDLPEDAGSYADPLLVDLDDDGDMDLLVGEYKAGAIAYRNIGGCSGPIWERISTWDVPPVASRTRTTVTGGDLDNDGDTDLLVGNNLGEVLSYENTGTASAPVWTRRPAWDGEDLGGCSAPALIGL
jgi:hypothetical protein